MVRSIQTNERCKTCRYWEERCCHALAIVEREDLDPPACRYFAADAHLFTPPPAEYASC